MAIKVNFKKIIEKAKREFERNEYQRDYTLASIELAKKYILNYLAQNSVQTPEELKNGILEEMYSSSQEFANISNIKNNVFKYEIIQLLMKDQYELDRLYAKVKGTEHVKNNSYYIDKPFEERKEDFARELIRTVQDIKEDNEELTELAKRYKAGDPEAKRIIHEIRSGIPPKKLKMFDEQFKAFLEDDLKIIKSSLPQFKAVKENELRESYIKILSFIGNFIDEYGLLDRYIQRYNQKLKNIGLFGLCIDREEFDSNSVFDEEILRKLKVDELPVMTAFWLNRYTKENQNLNNGIFAINALNLWGDILEGKTQFEITEEQIKAIFCKTEFLKTVNEKIVESVTRKLNNNSANVIGEQDDVVAIDTEEELEEIEELVRLSYYNEFEGVLPNSYAQLMDDLRTYLPLTSNTSNAYSHKNEIITTQILSYMRNNRIRNWGYIEDTDSKSKNDNMVILGIDYEGYNMPVRLHMHKQDVIRGLKEAGLEAIIPIYEGQDDFTINREMLSSYIIMLLTDRQNKEIRRLMIEKNKPAKVMNFVEHLNFLRDANKFPEHLMTPVTEKGRTFFVRPERRYINLTTNEKFVRNKGSKDSLRPR